MTARAWPAGNGEMARLIRQHDWRPTLLGPLEAWPQSLRTTVDIVLASGFPMVALCGPDLIQIYNDRYRDLMGPRHPGGLGQPTRDCWPEVWAINRPIYLRAQQGHTETFENRGYPIMRGGALRQAWFTLTYSPLHDETGAVAGVLVAIIDTTGRMQGEADRASAENVLHDHAAWLRGQREALIAAVNRMPLEASLGLLARTATDALGDEVRAAFFLANGDGTLLHHVVGMSDAYARAVDGEQAGPETLTFGLAAQRGDVVIAADVEDDPRWLPWRALARRFAYRGWWGFPIHTEAGRLVGVLAIYARVPRDATSRDLELASLLADTASIIIARQMDAEVRLQAEQALRESEDRLQAALQAGRMACWTWNTADDRLVASDTMAGLFGSGQAEGWETSRQSFALLHPDDRERHRKLVELSLHEGTGWHSVFRILRPCDGEVAWLEERAEPSCDPATGQPRMSGLVWDITEQKEASELQRVLLAEVQHRTRNLLHIVRSITDRILARSTSLDEFRAGFRDRLEALARVNALLSRLKDGDRTTFGELIRAELASHGIHDTRDQAPLITLEGPENVRLRSSTLQTFALGLHELATNAVKYGALSCPGGKLSIRWAIHRDGGREPRLSVDWRESGIVIPPGAADRRGFGRELIERALPYQLKAETVYAMTPRGVRCTITLPISTTQEIATDA